MMLMTVVGMKIKEPKEWGENPIPVMSHGVCWGDD